MKFGILVFPGTWSDRDCGYALESLGQEIKYVWHADTDVDRFDALVVPGGFSYGDYLRAGAIARFAPVMESVAQFAEVGGEGHARRFVGRGGFGAVFGFCGDSHDLGTSSAGGWCP